MILIKDFFKINIYREAEKDFDVIITFESIKKDVDTLYSVLKRNKYLIEDVINEQVGTTFIQIDLNDNSTFSDNPFYKETIVSIITDCYIKLDKLLDMIKIFYLLETLDKTTIEYLEIIANIGKIIKMKLLKIIINLQLIQVKPKMTITKLI